MPVDLNGIAPLNVSGIDDRLAALAALKPGLPTSEPSRDVNNHIHTIYSFSPYSPTAAVYSARMAGLATCGIMDHDSLAGADEFTRAGHMIGMATTVGVECRARVDSHLFNGRRINNPDQNGVIYMALHGVPHGSIAEVNAFFAPYRRLRNDRNRAMVSNINQLLGEYGLDLDFQRDVLPLSQAAAGGSVTERHIACALADRLLKRFPERAQLISFIKHDMKLPISAKVESLLRDCANPYAVYDLLGWIKSELIAKFYIPAVAECPPVKDVLELCDQVGAISAYPYLGDVGDSVTGDKRAQKFEDDFLTQLFYYLKGLGFRAITYMPSRNTKQQLTRVRMLCRELSFFEISGEDINSPRQSFICEAQRDPMFSHLYDATWALIAHEWLATRNPEQGFFSAESCAEWPDMESRTAAFAREGRKLFGC